MLNRIPELITNDMINYGTSKVQGASITTQQSNLKQGKPTSQEANLYRHTAEYTRTVCTEQEHN